MPFQGGVVPVSSQAQALLALYPLPNLSGATGYNFQVPVLNSSHQDVVQLRLDKTLGRRDQLYGELQPAEHAGRQCEPLRLCRHHRHPGHQFQHQLGPSAQAANLLVTSYKFSRLRTLVKPNFENRENVSGDAGITGNDQDPANWGPPALGFSSGIAGLSDANSSFDRNRTDAFSGSTGIYHGKHNITAGVDFREQQYNDFFQQNPRGAFTFTGVATQGACNNPAPAPILPISSSACPIPAPSHSATQTNTFANMSTMPTQPTTGEFYPSSPSTPARAGSMARRSLSFMGASSILISRRDSPLPRPSWAAIPSARSPARTIPARSSAPTALGIEPRIGISWRPIPASTVVVRAGYGIYHDTSVYLAPALQLAQQAPLSTSLNIQNSAACPLTLANGFAPCSSGNQDNYAVDPNFRVGYAQTWNLAVQRDLPFALQMTATYLGVKGTHGVQEFLPNTYPIGAVTPCPACPLDFEYRTSGGNSTRQSGQFQLRRRLKNGFTASLLYTYSKSMDNDAALGGQGHVAAASQGQAASDQAQAASPSLAIAQNWLNLRAERSLSTFDQRHLLNLQAQYTTGQGVGGGTLMTGWRGRLLKEWTVLTQMNFGPDCRRRQPISLMFPALDSRDHSAQPHGLVDLRHQQRGHEQRAHLNSAAYTAPALGQWGNAGRDSILGPGQFSLDSSLERTFRPSTKYNLTARIDSTNTLNHPVFSNWITTVNSVQFGLPASASPCAASKPL
jgi:hypothetical protein